MSRALPQSVNDDTPLRLDVAAALGFPDGTMSVSGLRREARRGRLTISRIAGKDYTSLSAIKEMERLCRLPQKDRDSGFVLPAKTSADVSPIPQPTSSETPDTAKARAAARQMLQALKGNSPNTLDESTSRRRHKGNVVRLKPRSRT